jgi:hypothetical protein
MNPSIYPAAWADMTKERAGQKYRPSNGTEGEIFMGCWCCQCARDKAMSEGCVFDECDDNERCDIIANTMAFNVEDDEYPKEWTYGQDGQPCCTAFVPAGDPIPLPRCTATPDMFGDEGGAA